MSRRNALQARVAEGIRRCAVPWMLEVPNMVGRLEVSERRQGRRQKRQTRSYSRSVGLAYRTRHAAVRRAPKRMRRKGRACASEIAPSTCTSAKMEYPAETRRQDGSRQSDAAAIEAM
jgi:hypothetical protein